MKLKIAVIVQRYGIEINGGAEYHARLIAEKMARHFAVEVFTSTARDYLTWEPHYHSGRDEVNGIPVQRYHVHQTRDPEVFGRIQEKVCQHEHTIADELLWLEAEGPHLPELLSALEKRESEFSHFIFFSYRYFHSYHGIRRFPEKSLLVPTAEHDDIIHLRLFRDFFRRPAAIVYNSHEEKELINQIANNQDVPGDIIGVGSEIPDRFTVQETWHKLGITPPYILYIGRLDENKGVPQLFDHFQRFSAETRKKMPLVLAGRSVIPVPNHPLIRHLGFISDGEKFDLLAGAELLAIPSPYESLSMVCLEAWALEKPVLVNGRTEVLKGQCRRSRGGLWYENYEEFREALLLFEENREMRESMGRCGRQYFQSHYTWEVIEGKYLRLLEQLAAIKNQQ